MSGDGQTMFRYIYVYLYVAIMWFCTKLLIWKYDDRFYYLCDKMYEIYEFYESYSSKVL